MVYEISNGMDKVQRELLFSTFHNKKPPTWLPSEYISKQVPNKELFPFFCSFSSRTHNWTLDLIAPGGEERESWNGPKMELDAFVKDSYAKWSLGSLQLRDSLRYWEIGSRKVWDGEDYICFVSCSLSPAICSKRYLETGYRLGRELFWASKADLMFLLGFPHYV